MSEEMNEQNTTASASPWLSKTVVIVITAHIVIIGGFIMFSMLKGDTGGKGSTEVVASTEDVGDSTTAGGLPTAEANAGTGVSNVTPVIPDTAAGSLPVAVAPTTPTPAPANNQTPVVTRPELASNVPVTPAPATAGGGTYTVQKGDSLYKVARQFKVSVAELKQSNGLTSDTVKTGQVLKVPAGGELSAPAPAPVVADNRPALRVGDTPTVRAVTDSVPSPAYQTYKVAPGDTLYKIARQFNTKADVIAKANNLSDPSKLKVGAEIKVPLTVRETARPVAPSLDNVNVARLPQSRS